MTVPDVLADTDFEHPLMALGHVLDDLAVEVAHAVNNDSPDLPHLTAAWQHLSAQRRRLTELQAELEEHIARTLRYGEEVSVGETRYKATRGRVREQWDHDLLIPALLDTRRLGEDGTFDESPVDVLREAYPFTPSLKPRRTVLKDRGLDPDEFCASEPGRLGLREVR